MTVIRQLRGAFEDSQFQKTFRSGLQVGFSSGFREVDAGVSSIGAYMRSIPVTVES